MQEKIIESSLLDQEFLKEIKKTKRSIKVIKDLEEQRINMNKFFKQEMIK